MPKGCLLFFLVALAAPLLLCSLGNAAQIELIDCTQSSNHGDALCGRATDGNTNGHGLASCSVTNNEKAWWKAQTYRLTYFKTIRIYNRQDCCPERLNDFSIKIDGQECVRHQSNIPFYDQEFRCNRVGKEIVIENQIVTHLTLCEVQVFGHTMGGRQLKLHSCSQSSTKHDGVCGRAIDGNKAQKYGQNSCTHTGAGPNEWWEARTERKAFITLVRIHNRLDCCSERLNDITILVGDRPCASYKSGSYFSEKVFECNAVGQAIRIRNDKAGPLTLCEVEVFGEYR